MGGDTLQVMSRWTVIFLVAYGGFVVGSDGMIVHLFPVVPLWGWSTVAIVGVAGLICMGVYKGVEVFGPKPAKLIPDWTMHELLQLLPIDEIDEHQLADDINKLTRDIEDYARTDQLACWGRKYSTRNTDENPFPLSPIPEEHWEKFSLDLLQCCYSEKTSSCCTEPRDKTFRDKGYADSFQDIRINKQQAEALWPMLKADR